MMRLTFDLLLLNLGSQGFEIQNTKISVISTEKVRGYHGLHLNYSKHQCSTLLRIWLI